MNKNKKKLILFDIDGTLFDNDHSEVPASTIEALKLVKDKAVIAIATGRAGYMLHSIEVIKDLFDYFVLINGQYVVASDKVIYKNPISRDLFSKLVKDLEELGVAYGFQGSKEEAINKVDDYVLESFQKLGLNVPEINKDFYLDNEIYQGWLFCDEVTIEKIKPKYPDFQFVKWMHVGYDILPIASTKAVGIKVLAEYLEIDMKDTIAIGDGHNDIEMLQTAGLGIAMGNASDTVKRASYYVTDHVSNDGIFKALKNFKLI